MRISEIAGTDLFAGTAARPLQIVRVTVVNDGPGLIRDPEARIAVRVDGPGVATAAPATISGLTAGAGLVAEVGVEVAAPATPATERPVTAVAQHGRIRAELAGSLRIAEPGWTMWMVSHFHYDPVWWNTQGGYAQSWLMLPDEQGELPDHRNAMELVRLHLDQARRDPDYKFVLAEIDYLKPFFDTHPRERADLLEFIAAGRIEIVGGSYNEPNTNLTCAESTIRNAIAGLAFQAGVLGARPSAAWMLDAFGFDPSYPGLMAAAGMAESSWARGPFHQWGPGRNPSGNTRMQFPSEFEWISPDGSGLLTSYMPNHYGAGWITERADDLATAERLALEQFRQLAAVAATPNVLLPVGGDHVVPSAWSTAIHRDWNRRYVWPRFVTALPGEYFAAVREAGRARDGWAMPQTRDMNPVYTGKDVSYIDTKQAQRAAEVAVLDGERLATLAWLAGAGYPSASLDKAWRLLAFGAHHDAITGTESDQVYLDLLAGWREAFERGDQARRESAGYLAGLADTASVAGGEPARPVLVWNTLSRPRSGMTRATIGFAAPGPAGIGLLDDTGSEVPYLTEGVTRHPDGSLSAVTLTFRAADIPAAGYRTYLAVPRAAGTPAPDPDLAGWQTVDGTRIRNDRLAVSCDPDCGGTLSAVTDLATGTELLAGPGNELSLQEEYPAHPTWGEGPWHLCPSGPLTGSASVSASVRAQTCPVGSRLVASYELGGLRIIQETLLWDGAGRVEFRTHVDGSIGQDRLLRAGFPTTVTGGLPVFQAGLSVIGRTPGPVAVDVAVHPYTLDCPAQEWFGVGSTARVELPVPGRGPVTTAIGVAEVIAPAGLPADDFAPRDAAAGKPVRAPVRELMVALARQGVTATCTVADGPRYGDLAVDSNLPDFRIAIGGPERNAFSARLLAGAGPAAAAALAGQLAATGTARLWLPAGRPRAEAFGPGADVRGVRALPVLIVDGEDLDGAIAGLAADLADAVIEVPADGVPAGAGPDPELAGHSVALLNRGLPGSLVTPGGAAYLSLMRACGSWPSGVWIDGTRRAVPDGSSFAWQHWSHTFEYALTAGAGDWREAGFALAGQDYNHPLLAIEAGVHGGPLPAAASLASVEPVTADLMALKPHGNPLAPAGPPDRSGGVTVRLRDHGSTSGPVTATLRLFTGVAGAEPDVLLEAGAPAGWTARPPVSIDPGTAGAVPGVTAVIPERGVITLRARTGGGWPGEQGQPRQPVPPAEPGQPGPAGARPPEPVQPVYARYWLHGKGPAPAGNLPVSVHLEPAEVAVLLAPAQPAVPLAPAQPAVPLAPAQPAVPLAPAQPAVPLEPEPEAAGRLRLTVACGPDPAKGTVWLCVPEGLEVSAVPAGLPHEAARREGGTGRDEAPALVSGDGLGYQLAGMGFAEWELTLRPLPGAVPGRRYLTARIADASGQTIEDAAVILLGEDANPLAGGALTKLPSGETALAELAVRAAAASQAEAEEADLQRLTGDLTLAPGATGTARFRLANRTAAALRGEAQLISPWGSWPAAGQWIMGFAAGPGETADLSFEVSAPADARSGERWWALVKVMYFGRLRYSEPFWITIEP